MITRNVILIEAFDDRVIDYRSLDIEYEDNIFRYVFDRNQNSSKLFHAGLFVDEMTLKRVVFRYPKNRRIGLLQESPLNTAFLYLGEIRDRFDTIFTHNKKALDFHSKFRKLFYGTSWVQPDVSSTNWSFDKKKLVSFVGSVEHGDAPGYSFRKQVVSTLSGTRGVDLWGRGLSTFDKKVDVILPYCFSIAMENTRQDYYFSEKLIDCFMCRTVPIYWGPDCVRELFDPRGILFFETIVELKEILEGLTFEKYESMKPSLIRNQNIALDEKIDSFEGMYYRLTREIAPKLCKLPRSRAFSRSRPAAGVRMLKHYVRMSDSIFNAN